MLFDFRQRTCKFVQITFFKCFVPKPKIPQLLNIRIYIFIHLPSHKISKPSFFIGLPSRLSSLRFYQLFLTRYLTPAAVIVFLDRLMANILGRFDLNSSLRPLSAMLHPPSCMFSMCLEALESFARYYNTE